MNSTHSIVKICMPQFSLSNSNIEDYCRAFCYPRYGKSFIIKGPYDRIDDFLSSLCKNKKHSVIVHYTDPKSIIVYGVNPAYKIEITTPTRLKRFCFNNSTINNNTKHTTVAKHQRCWINVIENYNGEFLVFQKSLRQVPRGWINELDPYVHAHNDDIENFETLFLLVKQKILAPIQTFVKPVKTIVENTEEIRQAISNVEKWTMEALKVGEEIERKQLTQEVKTLDFMNDFLQTLYTPPVSEEIENESKE